MKIFKTTIIYVWMAMAVGGYFSVDAQPFATPQSVSGIINVYTAVTAFTNCEDTMSVADASGFAIGDKVLIIQMQGADIYPYDSSGFGDVTNINSAGNYEFAHIANITGNNIDFTNELDNNYDVSGSVQMVRVPQYNAGVTINGTVTAQSWDGTTGGVVVFEATSVVLNAAIDVTGTGFRAGDQSQTGDQTGSKFMDNWRTGPCTNFEDSICSSPGTIYINTGNATQATPTDPSGNDFSTYGGSSWRSTGNTYCGCWIDVPACEVMGNSPVFDPLSYGSGQNFTCAGCTGWDIHQDRGAEKGEGIHIAECWQTYNRGKTANGGGGGNVHNGGGGGGSNYGAGGFGGKGYTGVGNDADRQLGKGYGGVALSPYYGSDKIFMGGGGGSGQGNDGEWTPGSNGGGIIIIQANQLMANGNAITANGVDNVSTPATTNYDGSGGGGGGGVVLLDIVTYNDALSVEAKGGKGNDNIHSGSSDCYAPGGGGGGGAIAFSQGSTPGGVITDVSGGPAGDMPLNGAACASTWPNWEATDGASGGLLHGIAFPEASSSCTLPVEWLSFTAKPNNGNVLLNWQTATETENDYFLIQKSIDGEDFFTIGKVDGFGNSAITQSYSYIDTNPFWGLAYYRLVQVDWDGSFSFSAIRTVNFKGDKGISGLYPNPVSTNSSLTVGYFSEGMDPVLVELTDILGRVIYVHSETVYPGKTTFQIPIPQVSKGTYFVSIKSSKETVSEKVTVQ